MPGIFYGYRERAPVRRASTRLWLFPPSDPEIRLTYWDWDLLGPIPFSYDVFSGYAGDDYPDDFVLFPFQSRLIIATIRDAPAYIRFTYDGVTEQPERRFDLGFARVEAARGFKIRNADPGIQSQYQIIPTR